MSPINLINVFKKYKGKWVAFRKGGNKVLASGASAKVVLAKAREKEKDPILFFVPFKPLPYVGGFNP